MPRTSLKMTLPKETVPISAAHRSPHLASAGMVTAPPYQRLLP